MKKKNLVLFICSSLLFSVGISNYVKADTTNQTMSQSTPSSYDYTTYVGKPIQVKTQLGGDLVFDSVDFVFNGVTTNSTTGVYTPTQAGVVTVIYHFHTTSNPSTEPALVNQYIKVFPNQIPIYRLYNQNTGEHFYTSSAYEKNTDVMAGWTYEGTGWEAPDEGAGVYRLYNPNVKGGDHYYTRSTFEATSLLKQGWKSDNGGKPVFYSGGDKQVSVAYNPNAQSGAHNFTTNAFEQKTLLDNGWKYGASAWKAVSTGKAVQAMNLDEVLAGKDTSIAGTWQNAEGNTITITADGKVQLSNYNGRVTIVNTKRGNGFVTAQSKPATQAASTPTFFFVSKGNKLKAGGVDGSDVKRDRIFFTDFQTSSAVTNDSKKLAYYRVS